MKGNSFATVATQILTLNQNLVEVLNKFDQIATDTVSNININIEDSQGLSTTYNLPSFGFLNQEIQRLNNNVNTLFGINEDGALIQTSENRWRKIILVDVNKEPNPIGELGVVSSFEKKQNYFFDGFLNPSMQIRFNLTDQIDDTVEQVKVRKYITKFQQLEDGTFTDDALRAIGSFDSRFKNANTVLVDDYIEWHRTTPGIRTPNNPEYSDEVVTLEPNSLLYEGIFSVIEIIEDSVNSLLWYELNTLEYSVIATGESRKLDTGDRLVINREQTSTIYEIEQISTAFASPRVKLRRIEGNEAIPVGVGTLKIFSPVAQDKSLLVNVGFNQRLVVFTKPIDKINYIQARQWSLGTGIYTSELILVSDDSDNGKPLEDYYRENVDDYGVVLKDFIKKQKPISIGIEPDAPVLVQDNFKVVQINTHLTESVDRKKLVDKYSQMKKVKSEIDSIDLSLSQTRKENVLSATTLGSKSLNASFSNKISKLSLDKSAKSNQLKSLADEVITLSNSPNITLNIEPKYRVRGFWEFPQAKLSVGSKPQEVIQFRVEYRYVSKSGAEARIENFTLKNVNNQTLGGAAFSNWEMFKTDVRQRLYDAEKDEYIWVIEDVSDADTPNINQLDIPISKNEKVQIRIKSISEVGYPDSPIESEWSEILEVEFPSDLEAVIDDTEFILQEANREESIVNLRTSLSGVDDILNSRVTVGDKTFLMSSDDIVTTSVDSDGNLKSLAQMLQTMQRRIERLEESIGRVRGIMDVFVYRNDEEFLVKNDEELTFNVECEEYLEPYNQFTNITGRVYVNQIYTIKDFYVRVVNNSANSPLGLLSNRLYQGGSDMYTTNAPQVFWVNDRDELIFNDSQGITQTQQNNQFLWSVNFDSGDSDSNITKVSEDIGNNFITDSNNSLSDVLSATEYNIGYSSSSILQFVGNNNSLMENLKWVDTIQSGTTERKLLSTIHPSIQNIEDLVERNTQKVKTIQPDDELIIPINIYFKMNAINPSDGQGENFEFINLNNATSTVRHIKKVKFFLENETENKPFIFRVKFNINRNRISSQARMGDNRVNITSRVSRGGGNRR